MNGITATQAREITDEKNAKDEMYDQNMHCIEVMIAEYSHKGCSKTRYNVRDLESEIIDRILSELDKRGFKAEHKQRIIEISW